jgi:hypothetical protein
MSYEIALEGMYVKINLLRDKWLAMTDHPFTYKYQLNGIIVMKKIYSILSVINEKIAVLATDIVGTMWCAYVFFFWSLIPVVIPSATTIVSYISQSILQLVLLSVIMVGQEIGGRKTEKRAEQDHIFIADELTEIKQMHSEIHKLVRELHKCHPNLKTVIDPNAYYDKPSDSE